MCGNAVVLIHTHTQLFTFNFAYKLYKSRLSECCLLQQHTHTQPCIILFRYFQLFQSLFSFFPCVCVCRSLIRLTQTCEHHQKLLPLSFIVYFTLSTQFFFHLPKIFLHFTFSFFRHCFIFICCICTQFLVFFAFFLSHTVRTHTFHLCVCINPLVINFDFLISFPTLFTCGFAFSFLNVRLFF